MGKKEKLWFEALGEGEDQATLWLFKQVRDEGGLIRGEDWAEGLVHVLAQLLGIRSACVALAERVGGRGVLVRNILDDGESLAHGNELMAVAVEGYDSAKLRLNSQYTLPNIRQGLSGYRGGDDRRTAFDELAGYLMLDALVAGRDRHHTNWAVKLSVDGPGRLAPSFDHGNALGFAEPEAHVVALLTDEARLASWVRRGKSQHMPARPTLVSVAVDALRAAGPSASLDLMERLEDVSLETFGEAVEAMPLHIMSEAHRRFSVRIVETNRRRLLDEFARRPQ
ncbi:MULTISPECIES: hypothetical protein [Propionibacteriaceae]|uniref:hypothetical protein n=1 Tax=Propionibacteriaceae TaxID=31957 RepID=UPI001A97B5B4|nr:hypothetical protein [Tessaracoccus sp. SD287]MBO1030261.1 hypothetical protein [Tessaracoccus sp. SD287]